jgi:two-component system cell cycle response regulator DivK
MKMAGESILIVEDNPTNLKLVKLLLSMEGYKIQAAICADDAFEILKTFHPDLILMDLQLPGKNGFDLTQEIKNNPQLKDICIVALTAYAMKGDEEKAKAIGCDGYMTKPISVTTFSSEIGDYLIKHGAKTRN